MSVQHYPAQAIPNTPLVNPQTGVPAASYGWSFLLALFNRTGGATGIIPKVSGPLTATGSSVINALGLTADWNLVTVTPPGSGVQITDLLALKPGNSIIVRNEGGSALLIYPPSDFQINALGIGTPYSLGSPAEAEFKCWTLNPNQLYTTI